MTTRVVELTHKLRTGMMTEAEREEYEVLREEQARELAAKRAARKNSSMWCPRCHGPTSVAGQTCGECDY